mmetsp:Transcript_8151/g.24235  ORF Transcript_8151/g.24235 Transcript_8151/m.24235 type:complete len:200 (+) Transcript_8151:201-800(+)
MRLQELVEPGDLHRRVDVRERELPDATAHPAASTGRGQQAQHRLQQPRRDLRGKTPRERLAGLLGELRPAVAREEARRDLRGPLLQLPRRLRLGLVVLRGGVLRRGRVALEHRFDEFEPLEHDGRVVQSGPRQRELRARPEDFEYQLGEERGLRVRARGRRQRREERSEQRKRLGHDGFHGAPRVVVPRFELEPLRDFA